MRITRYNSWARVVGTEPEEEWLARYLAIDLRDGTREDLLVKGQFPAGLVPAVERAAAREGFKVETRDAREPTVLADPRPDLSWLRDYQAEAVASALRAECGIVWAPPGAGKGEIAVALGMSIVRPRAQDGCVLFLVHRRNLAEDVATRWLRHTGERAGLAVARRWDVEGRRFVAATFSSVGAAFRRGDLVAEDLVERAYGLIVDECHVAPASTHRVITQRCQRARFRVGLSATPLDRQDRRTSWAIGALGPLCYRVRAQLLVARGDVAACRCTIARYQHGGMSADIPWPVLYQQAVVKSRRRNALVLGLAVRAPKPALVFVQRDDHGAILLDLLSSAGLRTARVWGETKSRDRDDTRRRLAEGEIEVVVCSSVWQEGLDIPGLAAVVNAGSGKSVIATVQRSGRGSRTTDDKGTYRLFDIWDDAPKMWIEKKAEVERRVYNGLYMLARWSAARMKAYRREAHEIEIEEVVT